MFPGRFSHIRPTCAGPRCQVAVTSHIQSGPRKGGECTGGSLSVEACVTALGMLREAFPTFPQKPQAAASEKETRESLPSRLESAGKPAICPGPGRSGRNGI